MMTGLLAVAVLISGHFFIAGYKRYVVNQEKKSVLNRQIQLLSQQQRDRDHRLQSILRMNRFLNHAELLGLEQNRWEVYHVDIQDSVTFSEMKKVIQEAKVIRIESPKIKFQVSSEGNSFKPINNVDKTKKTTAIIWVPKVIKIIFRTSLGPNDSFTISVS